MSLDSPGLYSFDQFATHASVLSMFSCSSFICNLQQRIPFVVSHASEL